MNGIITKNDLAGFIAEMLVDAILRINKCKIDIHKYGSCFDFSGRDIFYRRKNICEYCDVKGSLEYDKTCCIQTGHPIFRTPNHHYFALTFKCSFKIYFVNSYALWKFIKNNKIKSKTAEDGKRYYVISIDDIKSLSKESHWTLNIVDANRDKMTFEEFANKHFDIEKELKVLNSFKEIQYIEEINGKKYNKTKTINQQQNDHINNHIRGVCISIVDNDVPE